MIEFISKNGHILRVRKEYVSHLRKWLGVHGPKTFNGCLSSKGCDLGRCATCPFCLNYTQKLYPQKEKMEAIQELFDTYYNRSVRGNTIIGMSKPILFKELEK